MRSYEITKFLSDDRKKFCELKTTDQDQARWFFGENGGSCLVRLPDGQGKIIANAEDWADGKQAKTISMTDKKRRMIKI